MNDLNKLVIVGNGFDLAHGLKTSYKNFLDWYMCEAFQMYCINKSHTDPLIEIKNKYSGMTTVFDRKPKTFEEVLNFISFNDRQSLTYQSNFYKRLLDSFKENNWVDIERYYFQLLKSHFSNPNLSEQDKKKVVFKLNAEFDFLITKLVDYIKTINNTIADIPTLTVKGSTNDFYETFASNDSSATVIFLNFNYTETLTAKGYGKEDQIIHIHGRVADIESNPIIFGYGDESDPIYQKIEDSGENMYLEHIKSFGYFRTANYHKLLSFIDSAPYVVYIVGHSCGLSDRVLLNEIFEHQNCEKIEIFYHVRNNGSDNFKEITQEISRHFKPHNKNIMRRKVGDKNRTNIIPQNSKTK